MFGKSHRPLLMACALAVGLASAPMQAQVTATLVLKNGQRHTGQNLGYRIDRPEISVRTGQHEEPRVPIDQVAYVDYGGSPEVNVDLSGSEHALVLRDGSVIKGQVIELSHTNRGDQTTPYLVVFRTSGGEEKRLPVNQVARVYFSNSGSAPTTGVTPEVPEGVGIAVPGNQQWTPTGMVVRRGEVITFNTTGDVRLSGDQSDLAGSSGARSGRRAPNSPLPQHLAGALIGRIGNSAPFPIGDQTSIPMPAAGQLFLGINDDNLSDNSGGFRVNLSRSTRRR